MQQAWTRWSPSSSSYTACCRGSRGERPWCFWRRTSCMRTPWSASPLWWCSRPWSAERQADDYTWGTRFWGNVQINICLLSYFDIVWMTKTSLPRTDSWICTRVSMETKSGCEKERAERECARTNMHWASPVHAPYKATSTLTVLNRRH